MMKLEVHKGVQPPMGYSFIGLWETEEPAQNWYANALKCGDTKPYYLTYNNLMYTLWTMKHKNNGKMVGKGWK
jgi:hypothetical protein